MFLEIAQVPEEASYKFLFISFKTKGSIKLLIHRHKQKFRLIFKWDESTH